MIRRLGSGVAAVALVLVTAAAPAGADEVPAPWELTLTTPASTTSATTPVTAEIRRSIGSSFRLVVSTTLVAPEGLAPGCDSAITATTVTGSSPDYQSTATATTPCNGSYRYTVLAQRRGRLTDQLYDQAHRTGTLRVVVPPAPVAALVATESDGRSVELSWVHTAPERDFLGYAVQRRTSGDFQTVTSLAADATSYTDAEPPSEGGTVEYRVLTRRVGAVSGDEVRSDGGPSATAQVEPAPSAGGGDDPSGGGPGGAGPGDDGSSAGVTRPPQGERSATRVPGFRRGTSRTATPLSPPTTLDTGFDGELPFGDREPGSDDPVLPQGDETASMVYEDLPGRGLAVPVATALVLAVWAFHLRYLARAARPPG